jgi:hypothetical protein
MVQVEMPLPPLLQNGSVTVIVIMPCGVVLAITVVVLRVIVVTVIALWCYGCGGCHHAMWCCSCISSSWPHHHHAIGAQQLDYKREKKKLVEKRIK